MGGCLRCFDSFFLFFLFRIVLEVIVGVERGFVIFLRFWGSCWGFFRYWLLFRVKVWVVGFSGFVRGLGKGYGF